MKPQGNSSPGSCDQAVCDEWSWSLHAAAVQGSLQLSAPNYPFRSAPCYYEGKFAHRCILASMIHFSYVVSFIEVFQACLFLRFFPGFYGFEEMPE